MQLIFLITGVLSGILTLVTGYLAIKKFSSIIHHESKIRDILLNSLLYGAFGSLLFLTALLFFSLLDEDHSWSINDAGGLAIVVLCPGIIGAVGTTTQTMIALGYRNVLRKILQKKLGEKNNKINKTIQQ